MRGAGEGRDKQKFLHHVCVWDRDTERERGRYIVRIQLHGYTAHGVFRQSRGCTDASYRLQCTSEVTWHDYTRIWKLKHFQCWRVSINDWSWPGGNPESMYCQRGRPYLNSNLFVILVGWGEATNSYFYVKCYLLITYMHAPHEQKKKIFFLNSVWKSWSPFACLWALSL